MYPARLAAAASKRCAIAAPPAAWPLLSHRPTVLRAEATTRCRSSDDPHCANNVFCGSKRSSLGRIVKLKAGCEYTVRPAAGVRSSPCHRCPSQVHRCRCSLRNTLSMLLPRPDVIRRTVRVSQQIVSATPNSRTTTQELRILVGKYGAQALEDFVAGRCQRYVML